MSSAAQQRPARRTRRPVPGSIGSSWFVIWLSAARPFRQDPRFHAFAERLNLVEYWKVYGPPDGCALEKGKIACQ